MSKRGKKMILFALAVLMFLSTTAYKTDYFEIAKQIEIFTTIYKEINMSYVDKTNPARLMQAAIKPMLRDLDPYTTYLSEQDVESARINQSGTNVGIGARVVLKANKLVVVEVFEGLPADNSGIKVGDEIIGGPAYYIHKGLGSRSLAVFFALPFVKFTLLLLLFILREFV